MNATELMERASALTMRVKSSKTPDEAERYMVELRRLHDDQCIRCGCSSDHPDHQATKHRRLWRELERASKCDYLPRLATDEKGHSE